MDLGGVQVKQNELTKEKREEFKRIFRRLDNNGDGRVSAAELGRAMKLMGKNPTKKDMKEVMEQARAIMTQVDKNGDGYMQYPEFERIMAGVSVDIDYEKELLIGAFKKFDLNGDGFISKEELMKVLTKMGDKMPEEEAEAMVKEADLNGDGLISYDEFVQVCCGGMEGQSNQ